MEEIRATLSEPAGRAWDRLKAEEGVNASAMCEAIGLLMDEGRWFPSVRMLELARTVAAERGRRRR